MTFSIGTDHWIAGVRRIPTRKKGGRFVGPRFIIMHYTANGSVEATTRIFRSFSVSAHLVLGRDGTVVQMVPFNERAWHAGRSFARSKWGTPYSGLNSASIGIEMVNYGYAGNHVPSGLGVSTWPRWRHDNGGPVRRWQPYPPDQHAAAQDLCAALMQHYEIPAEHVLGHDEVSPARKVDPGPMFDMDEFRESLTQLEITA